MAKTEKFYLPRILPSWIELWLFISGVICLLDVGFTMLRPHTTKGGALEVFYYGWNLYATVDRRYADAKDIVTCATGRVMLIEIVMNFAACLLNRLRSRHTLLMAFTTNAFVLWKTVWFLVLYILPPEGTEPYFFQDKSNLQIFLIFWIPNGIWVIVPFFILLALWNRLAIPVNIEQNYQRKLSEARKQSIEETATSILQEDNNSNLNV